MLKEEKTTGWLAGDLLKVMKMWLWIFRNCDDIAQERFNQNDTDIKNSIIKCAQHV